MAKRRDQIELIAQRRKDKVPIRIVQGIKEFNCHLDLVQELRDTRQDGRPGKAKEVVSMLYTTVQVAGLADPIECKSTVKAQEDWDVPSQFEKAIQCAFFDSIKWIVARYKALMEEKKAQAAAKEQKGGDE